MSFIPRATSSSSVFQRPATPTIGFTWRVIVAKEGPSFVKIRSERPLADPALLAIHKIHDARYVPVNHRILSNDCRHHCRHRCRGVPLADDNNAHIYGTRAVMKSRCCPTCLLAKKKARTAPSQGTCETPRDSIPCDPSAGRTITIQTLVLSSESIIDHLISVNSAIGLFFATSVPFSRYEFREVEAGCENIVRKARKMMQTQRGTKDAAPTDIGVHSNPFIAALAGKKASSKASRSAGVARLII